MKKLFSSFLFLLTSICMLLSFTACGDNSSDNNHLVYETKYFRADTLDDSELEEYYIFYVNGTGEYRFSRILGYGMGTQSYTVSFRYTYADNENEAIACFFDSVEYDSNDTAKSVDSTWNQLLTVSPDVLMTKGGYLYVSENYLRSIPNFGK